MRERGSERASESEYERKSKLPISIHIDACLFCPCGCVPVCLFLYDSFAHPIHTKVQPTSTRPLGRALNLATHGCVSILQVFLSCVPVLVLIFCLLLPTTPPSRALPLLSLPRRNLVLRDMPRRHLLEHDRRARLGSRWARRPARGEERDEGGK